MIRTIFHFSLFVVGCWLASLAAAQENWPQFRGADSMGIATSPDIPEKWSTTENVAWKSDLPGRGWSSPVVWGDKIFVTSVVNTGEEEPAKKGLYFGGERPASKDEHHWVVLCLDLKTGKPLWDKVVHKAPPPHPIHVKNSYASETQVTDGKYVYSYFGNVGVYCHDMDGNLVWEKKMEPHAIRNGWGTAASPVLYKDRLYVVDDNDRDSSLLGLNALTGEEVFRTKRAEKSNWSTPFIWKNSQRTELVTTGTMGNRSYDLDGNLLWELKGMSSICIAVPYSRDDILYISSGYVNDRVKPVYAIKPGASGDITLKSDESSNDYVMWVNKTAGPYNPTSILYGDYLYVLYDQGMFACYDPKTGKEVYGKKRIPEGTAFTSSPWAHGDKIFCINESGVTFVIATGPEFKILDSFPLEEDEMCMATPAAVGNRLLIRTTERLYCLQNGAKLAESK